MNIKNIGVTVVLLMTFCIGSFAQGAKSIRINEVLVANDKNYQDDYGLHSPWIELFNTSFGTVDLRSCFLTNDKNNPTKYPIPQRDILTRIPPRQHTLFWADGMPNRGTFHVNFTLDPNKENWIGLYDANGRTLIDSVTIPAGIPVDHSYAREEDGKEKWVIKGGDSKNYVTPSTNNQTIDKNTKIDGFKKNDEYGFGMAIIAMGVVFFALLLLFISFWIIGSVAKKMSKRNMMKTHGITDHDEAKEKLRKDSGEVYAAIAMALHEYQDDAHDIEDTILTINKVKRNYSPWSSKIYTLRQPPHSR